MVTYDDSLLKIEIAHTFYMKLEFQLDVFIRSSNIIKIVYTSQFFYLKNYELTGQQSYQMHAMVCPCLTLD